METKLIASNSAYVPFMWLLAYLKLDVEMVTILCVLIAIDYSLGLIKSIKFKTFQYKVMISGIVAKVVILIIPISISFMFIGIKLFDVFGGYVSTIIKLLIIAETISILLNAISIYSGEEIEKPDLINKLTHKIRKFIEKFYKLID
ncbi:phage holin family protein [Arcobacter sp.]|uniref:phage holin family protein n=1 Tax=unclassified Arcobacter TaxID=2593671 RepID=UPI003B0037A0